MTMTAKNKRRGNDFEREVVKTARAFGLDAERAWASDGRSLGRPAGVDVILGGLAYQCKRRRRIAGYLVPADDVDGVIFRQDGDRQAYVVLRIEDYLTWRRVCQAALDKEEQEDEQKTESL